MVRTLFFPSSLLSSRVLGTAMDYLIFRIEKSKMKNENDNMRLVETNNVSESVTNLSENVSNAKT